MPALIHLPTGLSEKGGLKSLTRDEVVGSMVREVTRGKMSVHCLFCNDCAREMAGEGEVEQKCLRRLIQHFAPRATVNVFAFSFDVRTDAELQTAIDMLEIAHVFYFKGFGGSEERLRLLFGVASIHTADPATCRASGASV